MFLQVRIISLELIRIQCFIFSDNPSPFMRHEIARHTKHPSHVVLFNFRGGARVSIKQGWGVKVSGCPDTVGAIDGVEYLAGVLENAETFNVGEVLVPKKVVMMGLCHEDLSAYTKPNSRDYHGKQRYQVLSVWLRGHSSTGPCPTTTYFTLDISPGENFRRESPTPGMSDYGVPSPGV